MTEGVDAGLVRLVRVARALERDGQYNTAKLLWAAAFSWEIRASNDAGIPVDRQERDRDLETVIRLLETSAAGTELIAALRRGRQAALENRPIPREEIPEVYVCRDCGEPMLGLPPMRCPQCGARALTFRVFLPVYYLEPLEPAQLMDVLRRGPDDLEAVIAGLTETQLTTRPQSNRWSLRDVLAHLLVAQGLLEGRVEKMLSEDDPSLTGVAAWAMGGEKEAPTRQILDRHRRSRLATLDRLSGIRPEDWHRTARHEEFGRVTLLQQASYFARHEQYHLPRMEATRRVIQTQQADNAATQVAQGS